MDFDLEQSITILDRTPGVLRALLAGLPTDWISGNEGPNTWSAYPFPSSIGLYKEGQGYPRFDAAKAKVYYKKVVDKIGHLVEDTIAKWDRAGL